MPGRVKKKTWKMVIMLLHQELLIWLKQLLNLYYVLARMLRLERWEVIKMAILM